MIEKYSKISDTKLIIFDLGNVMININMEATIKAFNTLGIQDVEKYVTQSHSVGGFFTDFEQGLISPEEFCNHVRQMSGVQVSNDDIRNAWNAMIGDFPHENILLVEQLRKKHEVVLLSNTNQIHLEYFDGLANGYDSLSQLFDKVWYSHQMHMSKPNRNIYETVLTSHGYKAEEAVFFDDNQSNVDGAKAVGIASYLVTKELSTAKLIEKLQAL